MLSMHLTSLILFFIVITLGIFTSLTLYSLDNNSLLYYGDSISHLIIARKMTDWQDAGLHQLGTVWLPLPHILLAIPSSIDGLFFSGFAGLVLNLPALAITTMILYKILLKHLSKENAFLTSLLYPTNPNILYQSLTAMTETLLLLFFVLSAFYLFRFIESRNNKYIILTSIFIVFTTLCRYEAWFLPFILIPYSYIYSIKDKYKTILFSLLSLSGIIFWLLWNLYYYDDPFEFVNAEFYSASWQAEIRDINDTLFLNPLNIFKIYSLTMLIIYGPLVVSLINISKDYLYLTILPLFTLISLVIGIGEISFWFNSRFLILIAPLLIFLVSRFSNQKIFYLFVITIIYSLFMTITTYDETFDNKIGIVTYIDAKTGFFHDRAPVVIGEFMHSNYDDGNIMIITGSMQEHKIMINSWIRLERYDEIIESSKWKNSFKEPWLYNKWLIISSRADSDASNVARYWLNNIEIIYKYYNKIYEYDNISIFKLK